MKLDCEKRLYHVVRDHVHRNKVPYEFLYDAKPLIQMSQGHPKKHKKTCWHMWGAGGGEVYKESMTFYLTDFGIDH